MQRIINTVNVYESKKIVVNVYENQIINELKH